MSNDNTVFIQGGPLVIPPTVRKLLSDKQKWNMYPDLDSLLIASISGTASNDNIQVTRVPLAFNAKVGAWKMAAGDLILGFHARSIGPRKVEKIMLHVSDHDVNVTFPIKSFPPINNCSKEMNVSVKYIVAIDHQGMYLNHGDVNLEATIGNVSSKLSGELSEAGSNWLYKIKTL